jgi:hypothetical protein
MNAVNPASIRLPADLKAWLRTKAEEEGRSLSGQIVQTLKSAMMVDQTSKENTK